jgi:hypothetical protein
VVPIVYLFACLRLIISLLFLPQKSFIYLLKKADIMKSDVFDAVKPLIEVNTISTKINSQWEHFSKMYQEL